MSAKKPSIEMKQTLLKQYQLVGIVHESCSMPHLPIFEETLMFS